jgi:two-component system chemotaxis response regulator CheB
VTANQAASRVVVIGASAGGVEALSTLVRHLPVDIDAAIFIVLHIPPHTPSELHRILQRFTFGPRVVGVVLSGMLDDGTAGLWAIKNGGGRALVQDPASAQYTSMPESALRHVKVDGIKPPEALGGELMRLLRESPTVAAAPVPPRFEVENLIALEGNGLQAGVMGLGKVSAFTCPDCHGVLVQIEEGSVVRFRCHTGHAFSFKTLLAEINLAIDKGLWDTLRAIEERILLLGQMAEAASASGGPKEAAECRGEADAAKARVDALREMVLDGQLFGHGPEKI